MGLIYHWINHLKKQIIQTDQSNSTESPLAVYLNEIQLFSNSSNTELQEPLGGSIMHNTYFGVNYSYLQGLDVFHPPQA